MAPLAGWWLGRVIDGIDWRAGVRKGILWLLLMVPLFLVALKALAPTSTRRPFMDVTVNGLSNTAQWILALVAALVLVYFLYDRIVALGWGQSARAIVVSLSALLLVLHRQRLLPFQLHQLRLCDRADGLRPRHA